MSTPAMLKSRGCLAGSRFLTHVKKKQEFIQNIVDGRSHNRDGQGTGIVRQLKQAGELTGTHNQQGHDHCASAKPDQALPAHARTESEAGVQQVGERHGEWVGQQV